MKLVQTSKLPFTGVSHNEEIKKKVFLEKEVIPKLMMFSETIFKPGQSVGAHKHETMHEVFYITKGKAEFVINGQKIKVKKGDCITIEAGEEHSQINSYNKNVNWLYFGISTD